MNWFQREFNLLGGRMVARSGAVAILGTTGAKTGKRRRVPVGIVRRPDGSVVIAAGGDGRAWSANLRANPRCTLDGKGSRGTYQATLLAGEERDAAAAELTEATVRITRGATWTNVYVLHPVDADAPAAGPA